MRCGLFSIDRFNDFLDTRYQVLHLIGGGFIATVIALISNVGQVLHKSPFGHADNIVCLKLLVEVGYQIAADAYMLTTFLLDTGARYNEVARLRWSQVDLSAGTVNLYRPKVQNESILTLPQRTLMMLRGRWRAMEGRGYSYVFPKFKGGSWAGVDLPRGHATQAIQAHIERCGLNSDPQSDKVTPHTFRDTYAARLVQAGVSLQKVSHLLGHSNVLMTQKYAHLCPEEAGAEAAAVLNRLHSAGTRPVAQDDGLAYGLDIPLRVGSLVSGRAEL